MTKRVFLIAAIAVFIGGSLAGGWSASQKGVEQAKTAISYTEPKMRYRTLANGAVIYEEVPGEHGTFTDIAPAAGGDATSAEPSYHYDPLTQTYRRRSVDMQGNSSQDIFNTKR